MNDAQFKQVAKDLKNGYVIFAELNQGKYRSSIVQLHDTKVIRSFYGGSDNRQYHYDQQKIKVKINNRIIWQDVYNLRLRDNLTQENIVTKVPRKDYNISKDFLGKEFSIDDVVFVNSTSYGGILGVVNEIAPNGTIKINIAKSGKRRWGNRKVFVVPHSRTNRIIIIDDPQMMLLKT